MITATITKLFDPFTISPVMQISVDAPEHGLTGLMVLKLYDRRFGEEVRELYKIPLWSPEIEDDYRGFVQSGAASEFIRRVKEDEDFVEGEGDDAWNIAQNEAYLHYYQCDTYETELEVYDRLKDVQGKDVPCLRACVTLLGCPTLPEPLRKCFDVPGIILDYVDGFPLTDLETNAPKDTWQSIIEDAIRIVMLISERDIRNKDVKTRSFIIRRDPITEKYDMKMIDFGECVFRGPGQSDEEWRKEKWSQDEEGAVGVVMEHKLKGGFVYTQSLRYMSDRDESYDDEVDRADEGKDAGKDDGEVEGKDEREVEGEDKGEGDRKNDGKDDREIGGEVEGADKREDNGKDHGEDEVKDNGKDDGEAEGEVEGQVEREGEEKDDGKQDGAHDLWDTRHQATFHVHCEQCY